VELLRDLIHHVMQTQEAERKWVTSQLHKNVSQLAYLILIRCGTLAKNIPAKESASRSELMKISDLASQLIESIRCISRILRPGALDDIGLVPVLRAECEEFGKRTRIGINLDGVTIIGRLPAEVETALYRILQKALQNVEQHAHAHRVTVNLTQRGGFVQLFIKDDGVGFNPNLPESSRKTKRGYGLAGMRERAACVDGTLSVKSALRAGTEIEARIPLPSSTRAKKARIRQGSPTA